MESSPPKDQSPKEDIEDGGTAEVEPTTSVEEVHLEEAPQEDPPSEEFAAEEAPIELEKPQVSLI